jgi:N-acylneuraminate cytidylyltransferase/CMP-N,N'-diacetyllegionaminic acid synthase
MLALIPARGGSKGIPKKNIKDLWGEPLIFHTIKAALAADSIDRVIISTDDTEIADLVSRFDVEIPFLRPKELACDDSLAIDNYIYTIERLNSEYKEELYEFTVLLPTSPLRLPDDIDEAVALYYKKNADSVISCTELAHPMEWIFKIDAGGVVFRDREPDPQKRMNRQFTRKNYVPNGAIYVFNFLSLKANYSYYSHKTFAYVMPAERSVDIDTEFDFELAEFFLKKREENA